MLVANALGGVAAPPPEPPLFDDAAGSLGLLALYAGPTRWHTPSSAARAMAAAAARACPPLPLAVFCASDATLVLEELPPPPMLLLLPMVLAPCDTLPPSAALSLSAAARDPCFAGFVGGPPGRALFCPAVSARPCGAGGSEPTAHVLDPHAEVAAAQPLRRRAPTQLALKHFSPSLAVGFFLRTAAERDAFAARLRGPSPLLSLAVVERRPAAARAAPSGRGEAEGHYDFADFAAGGGEAPLCAAAALGPPPRWGANFAHRFAASLRALARAWGFVSEYRGG